MPLIDADADVRALLERVRTVAVVGASSDAAKPSHGVFVALTGEGRFDVTPVTPNGDAVAGVPTVRSLADYAAARGAPPDLVDVFRQSRYAADAAREAVAAGAGAIWFQLGVATTEAIAIAADGGLDVVAERCLKIESRRLLA